jgi:hypothetical protein
MNTAKAERILPAESNQQILDEADLDGQATAFLGKLTDRERESLKAFLNSPTALAEVQAGVLPFEFIRLAADALQRAGLD